MEKKFKYCPNCGFITKSDNCEHFAIKVPPKIYGSCDLAQIRKINVCTKNIDNGINEIFVN